MAGRRDSAPVGGQLYGESLWNAVPVKPTTATSTVAVRLTFDLLCTKRRSANQGGSKLAYMEWTAPVSTAIGGLIALGSSFLVDRHRWHRDRELHKRSELRSAYAAFLQATTEASEILWNISQGHDNDEAARARALTVLRDSRVLARHFELSLVTNDEMTLSTSHLIKLLIAYRDAVGRGVPYDDEELRRPRKEFNRERERLIRVMRETL